MPYRWNLHQRYFVRKILFSDVISFAPYLFHKWGIISDDISRNWKGEKSVLFFSSQLTCDKRSHYFKIWHDHFNRQILVCKSSWLTLFASSKVTRGNFFDFKMLLTIFSLQKQSKSSTLFLRRDESVLTSQLTLLTENSSTNCHFSKKDILQIIRNPDLNKAHGHDMISIRVLNVCGGLICQSQEIIFKTWY